MRTLLAMATGIGLMTALSGCNSLDALTPPENIGGDSGQSAPLTQSDLDTMATQQPVMRSVRSMPVDDGPVRRSAGLPEPDTRETAFADGTEAYRNPAGSLEAQASALGTDPPPQVRMQESAVGYPARGNEVRETAAVARDHQSEDAPARDVSATEQGRPAEEDAPSARQTAIPPADRAAQAGSIRFLPIIGAPVEAVRPLSEQLGAEARARGLTIKTAADPGSQHILKGYFSAFKDGRKTTIVYVWDVLDGAGNRLHRIQGQDSVTTEGSDLWSEVPAATMRDIATKSLSQYLAWRDGTAG